MPQPHSSQVMFCSEGDVKLAELISQYPWIFNDEEEFKKNKYVLTTDPLYALLWDFF